MICYRVFDPAAADYVDLPEPVPKGDPRYEPLRAQSRAALRAAGRRDRGETE